MRDVAPTWVIGVLAALAIVAAELLSGEPVHIVVREREAA